MSGSRRVTTQSWLSGSLENQCTNTVSFLHTNKELSGEKKERKNPTYSCNKEKKYLGINLTKEMKDMYTENYKTLMKETEEDTNKWKGIPCTCIVVLSRAIYRINAISTKVLMAF